MDKIELDCKTEIRCVGCGYLILECRVEAALVFTKDTVVRCRNCKKRILLSIMKVDSFDSNIPTREYTYKSGSRAQIYTLYQED